MKTMQGCGNNMRFDGMAFINPDASMNTQVTYAYSR